MRLRYGNAAPHTAKGRELSIDAPCPAVLALNAIHNGHQFVIEPGGAMPSVASAVEKPPYRVPRLTEIAAIPANGYTVDEIERKRLALEGVQVPITAGWNESLLRRAGFREVDCFWRWHNFGGWVAVKGA